MLMVDGFAQNYRWSMTQILALTMPQIVMLNAASDVNKKRLDIRMAERKHDRPARRPDTAASPQTSDMPMFGGKRIDQLTSAEYLLYHRVADE